MSRVVANRLRVVQRDFLTRRGGRTIVRSSVAVDYNTAYMSKYKSDYNKCPRVIDAEVVHGDEHGFWTARRDFYRSGAVSNFYPLWDRQAQVLIMLTREVPRVPQEAAFRLFALGFKLMLMPRLVTNAEMLLPAWVTMNMESLLSEVKAGDAEGSEKVKEKGTKAEDVAAAADTTGAKDSVKAEEAAPAEGEAKPKSKE